MKDFLFTQYTDTLYFREAQERIYQLKQHDEEKIDDYIERFQSAVREAGDLSLSMQYQLFFNGLLQKWKYAAKKIIFSLPWTPSKPSSEIRNLLSKCMDPTTRVEVQGDRCRT